MRESLHTATARLRGAVNACPGAPVSGPRQARWQTTSGERAWRVVLTGPDTRPVLLASRPTPEAARYLVAVQPAVGAAAADLLEDTSPLLTLPETTPAGVAVRDAATSLVRTLLGEPSQPPAPVTLPRNWPNRPGASVARAAQVLDELAGTGQGWQDLAHGPDVPPGVGNYLAAFAPAGAALARLLRATASQGFTEGQSAGQHLASTHTAELIMASHRAAA